MIYLDVLKVEHPKSWLNYNRSSPLDAKILMEENQTVDQVLFPNPVIKKQIEEFKNDQSVEGPKFG